MDEPKQTPIFLDKTFLTVILSPLFVFLSKKLGVELNTTEIVSFFATVITFVIYHKWKGATLAKAAVAAKEAEARITDSNLAAKAIEAAINNPQSGVVVERIKQ